VTELAFRIVADLHRAIVIARIVGLTESKMLMVTEVLGRVVRRVRAIGSRRGERKLQRKECH